MRKRAEVMAQDFDALEARFPQLNELATQGQALVAQTRWLIGSLAILGVVLKRAEVLIGP
jgi:hypothetical protein